MFREVGTPPPFLTIPILISKKEEGGGGVVYRQSQKNINKVADSLRFLPGTGEFYNTGPGRQSELPRPIPLNETSDAHR